MTDEKLRNIIRSIGIPMTYLARMCDIRETTFNFKVNKRGLVFYGKDYKKIRENMLKLALTIQEEFKDEVFYEEGETL